MPEDESTEKKLFGVFDMSRVAIALFILLIAAFVYVLWSHKNQQKTTNPQDAAQQALTSYVPSNGGANGFTESSTLINETTDSNNTTINGGGTAVKPIGPEPGPPVQQPPVQQPATSAVGSGGYIVTLPNGGNAQVSADSLQSYLKDNPGASYTLIQPTGPAGDSDPNFYMNRMPPAPTPIPNNQGAPPAPAHITHFAKTGDTWTSIARRYGVSVQALQTLNSDSKGSSQQPIKAGQGILIP
jgi:LysM repeat protein